MASQHMNSAAAEYLQLVAEEFQFNGTLLSVHLKPEWKEKTKANFIEPYLIDLSAWPTRAEVTLLSEDAPLTKQLAESSLVAAIRSMLQLVSDKVEWPEVPTTVSSTSDTTKSTATIALSGNVDEVEDEEKVSDTGDGDDASDQSFPSASDIVDSDASFGEPDEVEEDPMEETDELLCRDLQQDIDRYLSMFGEGRVTHKYSVGRNATDLTFSFDPAKYISQTVADAWAVRLDLPIAICLRISASRYRDVAAPRAEIWQPGAKTSIEEAADEVKREEALKEEARLKEIELIQVHYPKGVPPSEYPILADMVAKAVPGYTPGPTQPPKERPYNAGRFGLQVQLTNIMNAFLAKHWLESTTLSSSSGIPIPTQEDEPGVKTLLEMGYARNEALRAWNTSKGIKPEGDLHASIELLLDPASSAHSSSHGNGDTKRTRTVEEVDWSHGFLVAFGSYFIQRFATVNDYCVICDLPHIGARASPLKPCVCTRESCRWSFQQLGVGSDASNEIAQPPPAPTPTPMTATYMGMHMAAPRNMSPGRAMHGMNLSDYFRSMESNAPTHLRSKRFLDFLEADDFDVDEDEDAR